MTPSDGGWISELNCVGSRHYHSRVFVSWLFSDIPYHLPLLCEEKPFSSLLFYVRYEASTVSVRWKINYVQLYKEKKSFNQIKAEFEIFDGVPWHN